MFANVIADLDDLRQDMTKRTDRIDERALYGQEKLREELADAKLQAKCDQALLAQNFDQCLAENIALVAKGFEERERRMTQEIERLLNDHDRTNTQTMTNLESRLDEKADLMMRNLEERLTSYNRAHSSDTIKKSRKTTNGFRKSRHTEAPTRPRANFESKEKKRLWLQGKIYKHESEGCIDHWIEVMKATIRGRKSLEKTILPCTEN